MAKLLDKGRLNFESEMKWGSASLALLGKANIWMNTCSKDPARATHEGHASKLTLFMFFN